MYMAYKRTGGVKKVNLKESTSHKQELIMPEDHFYPVEAYTRLFGDGRIAAVEEGLGPGPIRHPE